MNELLNQHKKPYYWKTNNTAELDFIFEHNNSVDPDLKKFLDEYEVFIDDYIAFMTRYNESENTAELITNYIKMISRYGTMEESLSKYDEENMLPADEVYYLEVLTRCNAKHDSVSID